MSSVSYVAKCAVRGRETPGTGFDQKVSGNQLLRNPKEKSGRFVRTTIHRCAVLWPIVEFET
jgi:hypothetical protein